MNRYEQLDQVCSDEHMDNVDVNIDVGVLAKNGIDVVAGQKSWETEDTIHVEVYKWFGKRHSNQCSQRGEEDVGFLVHDCLVNEVEFISSVKYDSSSVAVVDII